MTGLLEFAGLRIVAVMGNPPTRSWLDVPSFVCAMPNDAECVLIVNRIVPGHGGRGDRVDGFRMPASWLNRATDDGLAFLLESPLATKDRHRLVRIDESRFKLREHTHITTERRTQLTKHLDVALTELASGRSLEVVRDTFDEAYATDPHDLVTVALRAGAACLDGADDDWRDETVEDLVRVSEHHGVLLLTNLRQRPGWNRLGHPKMRETLVDNATLALSHALAAPTELLSPLSAETITQGAEVAARWRTHGAKAYPGLSPRTLVLATKGDPHAIQEARDHAAPLEESVPTRPLDQARARLVDLERYCETVYALELRTDRIDRGVRWQNFLAETAGVRPRRRAKAWQEGKVAAESLRTTLGLNGQRVRGLRKLLAARAGVHDKTGEALEGVDALGVVGALAPPCVHFMGAGSEDPAGRSRFALAQQLCHFLLDRRAGATSSWACGSGAHGVPGTSHGEKRARAFAAWFLAPREGVIKVAGERVSPQKQGTFVEKAMRVREHFGLTAVTSGEHLQNCWGVESRGPLNEATRTALRQAASRVESRDFDTDLPPPPSTLRGGLFADVLRDAYETGELDIGETTRLLGSTASEVTDWLRPENVIG